MMVGESWDIFAKRVVVVRKHLRYHVWKSRGYAPTATDASGCII